MSNLTAATDLVSWYGLCDVEIGQMILKNYRATFPCLLKLCASFRWHMWIENGVFIWKLSNQDQFGKFLAHVSLKFNLYWKNRALLLCPWKIWALFHNHLSIEIGIIIQRVEIENNLRTCWHVWPWNSTDDIESNRAPLLCPLKLCASFHCAPWSFVHHFIVPLEALCIISLASVT